MLLEGCIGLAEGIDERGVSSGPPRADRKGGASRILELCGRGVQSLIDWEASAAVLTGAIALDGRGGTTGLDFGEALGDLDLVTCLRSLELTLRACGVCEDLLVSSGPSWLHELAESSSPLCSKVTASGSACSICK